MRKKFVAFVALVCVLMLAVGVFAACDGTSSENQTPDVPAGDTPGGGEDAPGGGEDAPGGSDTPGGEDPVPHTHAKPDGAQYTVTEEEHSYVCGCGETVTEKHTFGEDGICAVCGYGHEEPSVGSEGLEFALCDDGESYVVTGYSGKDSDVVIPAQYNGMPVTAIGENAFRYAAITSVEIPDGVIEIRASAFDYCHALREIVVPDSVQTIGRRAFASCLGCFSVTIGSSVTTIDRLAFQGSTSIYQVYNRSSLDIEAGSSDFGGVAKNAVYVYTEEGKGRVTTTADDDFIVYADGADTRILKYIGSSDELVLPSVLRLVDGREISEYGIFKYAFQRMKFTSVRISEAVTFIGSGAFNFCNSLTSAVFEVTEGWKEVWLLLGSEYDVSSADLSDPARAAEILKGIGNDEKLYRTKD